MRAKGPGQSALFLLDVVDVLSKLRISYAVVGALAASFYGIVRASMDADAVISFQGSKGDRELLLSELIRVGFDVTQRQGNSDDPIAGVINVEDCYHNRVDLLMGIRGMKADIFSRTINSAFLGSRIRIVSVEDFIAMKIFAGGPQDIEDIKGVLKVSAEKINLSLLKELTLNYGKRELKTLKTILKECL